jgi:hypothetical protein
MKRWIILATAATALAGAGVVIAANAANAADHGVFDATFPVDLCGYPATDHVHAIDNFGFQRDGETWDSGNIVETFTLADGRALMTRFAGHLQNLPPVENADGSTTYPTRWVGAQMQTKVVDGPMLQTNSGVLYAYFTVDADGNPIDFSVSVKAGPNPNPTGLIDCSVVLDYLNSN